MAQAQENPYAEKVRALSNRLNELNREIENKLVDGGRNTGRSQEASVIDRDAEPESREETAGQTKEDDTQTADGDTGNIQITEFRHTKTDKRMPSAKLKNKVSKETYRQLRDLAQKHKGGYSRFAGQFLFQDEQGRAKFVQEAEALLKEENRNASYSLSKGSPATDLSELRKGIDERIDSEIKAVFPMAKHIRPQANSDGTLSYRFKMPNGADVQIKIGDTLSVRSGDESRARSEHGIGKNVAITVNGVTYTSGNKAIIALARNGKEGTVYHELFHVAYSMALLDSEKDALHKAYGDKAKAMGMSLEEYSADRFRDWVAAKQAGKHVNYGKLWNKINDMAQKLADLAKKLLGIAKTPEVNELFSNIESGKIWQRSIDKNVREYDNETKEIETRIGNRLQELVDKGKVTDDMDLLQIRELLMVDENNAVQSLLRKYKQFKDNRQKNKANEFYTALKGVVKIGERKRVILSEKGALSRYTKLLRRKNMGGKGSHFAKVAAELLSRGNSVYERGNDEPISRRNRLKLAGEYAPSWKDPIVDNIRNEVYDEYNRIEQARERSDRDALSNAENEGDNRLRYSASDNSKEGSFHRIKNMLGGRDNTDAQKFRYRKHLTEMLEKALDVRIRYGKLEGENDVVYKEKDKVLRSRHAYDWENILPFAGKLAAEKLGINNPTQEMNNYIAYQIVSEYSLICMEDLNRKAMQKRYGRKISDLGFVDFVNKLKYIASKTGAAVVEVDRFCGKIHNRDTNAAINIVRPAISAGKVR